MSRRKFYCIRTLSCTHDVGVGRGVERDTCHANPWKTHTWHESAWSGSCRGVSNNKIAPNGTKASTTYKGRGRTQHAQPVIKSNRFTLARSHVLPQLNSLILAVTHLTRPQGRGLISFSDVLRSRSMTRWRCSRFPAHTALWSAEIYGPKSALKARHGRYSSSNEGSIVTPKNH